jgi:hypothetical protein
MGFKDKMMGNMMDKMTSEEKKEMMDAMMENFFSGMTSEEKQEMMNNMMPKMMEQMMGSSNTSGDNPMMKMMSSMMGGNGSMMGGSPMMGMMNSMMSGSGPMMNMMGNQGEQDSNPMDMCKEMMKNMSRNNDIATFATPEVRQLFEDWVQQVDDEIINIIKTDNTITPEQIAEQLKISKDSVLYFLTRLAQKDKITLNIRGIKADR